MSKLITSIHDMIAMFFEPGFLLSWSIKSSVIIILLYLLVNRLRRFSAATRHFIWTAGFVGLLLLPMLSANFSLWNVEIYSHEFVAPTPTPASPIGNSLASNFDTSVTAIKETPLPLSHEENTVSFWQVASAIWLSGVLVLVIIMAVEVVWLLFIATGSRPDSNFLTKMLAEAKGDIGLIRKVKLVTSKRIGVPLTFGLLRPVIVLPLLAQAWEPSRLRTVLVHELAHIKRQDYSTNVIVNVCCIVLWFNPLIWLAAYQQKILREKACDDLVLSRDIKASEYARQLLEIARLNSSTNWVINRKAVALADGSGLKSRVAAILDSAAARGQMNRKWSFAASVLAAIAILPLAALNMKADKLVVMREEATAEVVPFIDDEAYLKKEVAILSYSKMPGLNGVRPLMSALAVETDYRLKSLIIDQLARYKSNYTFYDIAVHVGDKNPQVRSSVVKALGAISCLPAYLILEERLNDPDPQVRQVAQNTLTSVDFEKLRKSISGFSYNIVKTSAAEREQSVSRLAKITQSPIIDKLKTIYGLKHASRDAAMRSMKALANSGSYNQLSTVVKEYSN